MAAAAAGALKGAVTAVLPPVKKAAGVSEESRETQGPGEVPRSQDQREIRQNDTTWFPGRIGDLVMFTRTLRRGYARAKSQEGRRCSF